MTEQNKNYTIIDLSALFYSSIHWVLFKKVFKEDVLYAMRLVLIYIFYGEYYFSEVLSSYLDGMNLDDLVNQNLISFLKLKEGKVFFCTTMCDEICDKILNFYRDVFSGYLNSSKQFCLKNHDKLNAIQNLVGDGHLTYISCTKYDLEIWKHCNTIGLVLFYNYTGSLLKKIKNLKKEYIVFYVNQKQY